MEREEMKEAVLEYINRNDAVSYAELQWLFEQNGYDYKGDVMACSDQNEHVVFWSGWNKDTFDMMGELIHDELVHREPTGTLTYLIDGAMMNFPVVKRNAVYKTDHWLPTVFMKGKG